MAHRVELLLLNQEKRKTIYPEKISDWLALGATMSLLLGSLILFLYCAYIRYVPQLDLKSSPSLLFFIVASTLVAAAIICLMAILGSLYQKLTIPTNWKKEHIDGPWLIWWLILYFFLCTTLPLVCVFGYNWWKFPAHQIPMWRAVPIGIIFALGASFLMKNLMRFLNEGEKPAGYWKIVPGSLIIQFLTTALLIFLIPSIDRIFGLQSAFTHPSSGSKLAAIVLIGLAYSLLNALSSLGKTFPYQAALLFFILALGGILTSASWSCYLLRTFALGNIKYARVIVKSDFYDAAQNSFVVSTKLTPLRDNYALCNVGVLLAIGSDVVVCRPDDIKRPSNIIEALAGEGRCDRLVIPKEMVVSVTELADPNQCGIKTTEAALAHQQLCEKCNPSPKKPASEKAAKP